MQPGDIERLSRAVVPGQGTPTIRPLGAGLLNETYRVVRDGAAYTLKVAAEGACELGLDLAWEAQVLKAAANAGLAPPLVYCDPVHEALVTLWVEGRSWSPQEVRLPANIRKIAALMRRVHALKVPALARVMSPMSWACVYGAALARQIRRLNAESSREASLRMEAAACWDALCKLPGVAGVVCHSDWHTLNLIQSDEALILLDWEYVHVADPLWDLAGWSANNDFEAETQRQLLMNYFESPLPSIEWTRFRLLLWLYDYVCLLWSELYLSLRRRGVESISERAALLDARLHLPAH